MSEATFAEAEKVARVTLTPAERGMAAASWRRTMAPLLERRAGPRRVTLDATLAAATRCNGVKDLLDTAGIATTYGAEPFKDRIPAND